MSRNGNAEYPAPTGAQAYTHTYTHQFYTLFFRDYPGQLVPEKSFWTFMVQGKITKADTLTIRLGATPSGLISGTPPSSPFLHRMPFLLQPSNFILAWDRHQICWLAYSVQFYSNTATNLHHSTSRSMPP